MTYAAQKNNDVIDYLLNRRSTSLALMGDERPKDEEIELILKAAARTPDHGKMFPWYFIVIKDGAREKIKPLLAKAYKADEDKDAAPAKIEFESERLMRAPMAIMVVSRMREGKHPIWEQFLSAGAVCMNLSLACHALGYGVNWLSEWYSYSPTFRHGLGLDERDNIAGIMYIGNVLEQPEERPRPELQAITTDWNDMQTSLKKGEEYDQNDKGLPDFKIFGFSDKG